MHAITPAEIADWIDFTASEQSEADRASDAYYAPQIQSELDALMVLPASKRFYYFCHYEGSLAEICPNCGTRYVEIDNWSHPDMVGETCGTTYECCGHTESMNTALEYRNGVAVDIR